MRAQGTCTLPPATRHKPGSGSSHRRTWRCPLTLIPQTSDGRCVGPWMRPKAVSLRRIETTIRSLPRIGCSSWQASRAGEPSLAERDTCYVGEEDGRISVARSQTTERGAFDFLPDRELIVENPSPVQLGGTIRQALSRCETFGEG